MTTQPPLPLTTEKPKRKALPKARLDFWFFTLKETVNRAVPWRKVKG